MPRQRRTRRLGWLGAAYAAIELTRVGAGAPIARADDASTSPSLPDAGSPFERATPLPDVVGDEPDPSDGPAAPEAPPFDVEACFAELSRAGVAYERVSPESAPRVLGPLWLRGPLGGVIVESTRSTDVHHIMACPLAVALLSVSDVLRAEGVTRLETFSIYRPAPVPSSTPTSGRRRQRRGGGHGRHPRGLAIDIGAFVREGSPTLRVLEHWGPRSRRRLRCTSATMTAPRRGRRRARGVTAQSAALHRIHCGIARRRVFTVMLSPHYNRAHHNHFHWDVDPAVSWRSVY